MYKWKCTECDWNGDEPLHAHPDYEDGGWMACPNGCKDKWDGEPLPVVLNIRHPDNMRQYAKALAKVHEKLGRSDE